MANYKLEIDVKGYKHRMSHRKIEKACRRLNRGNQTSNFVFTANEPRPRLRRRRRRRDDNREESRSSRVRINNEHSNIYSEEQLREIMASINHALHTPIPTDDEDSS